MLTKVTAYSQWSTVAPLVLNIINRPETDQFEVRNIEGLGAVKATVNTTPLGSVKGSAFTGTSVAERNIVFTLGLDPDWDEWTVSRLRRLLDLYFMPEQSIRLVFESMEFSPVEIFGYIESNEPNMFSKDPEHQVSIICPEPNFVSVDFTTLTGLTTDPPIEIDYKGNIETGYFIQVQQNTPSEPDASEINITNIIDEYNSNVFTVDDPDDVLINPANLLQISSVERNKFVQSISGPGHPTLDPGTVTPILHMVRLPYIWPTLKPGVQDLLIESDFGAQNWTVTYYERFGSL